MPKFGCGCNVTTKNKKNYILYPCVGIEKKEYEDVASVAICRECATTAITNLYALNSLPTVEEILSAGSDLGVVIRMANEMSNSSD